MGRMKIEELIKGKATQNNVGQVIIRFNINYICGWVKMALQLTWSVFGLPTARSPCMILESVGHPGNRFDKYSRYFWRQKSLGSFYVSAAYAASFLWLIFTNAVDQKNLARVSSIHRHKLPDKDLVWSPPGQRRMQIRQTQKHKYKICIRNIKKRITLKTNASFTCLQFETWAQEGPPLLQWVRLHPSNFEFQRDFKRIRKKAPFGRWFSCWCLGHPQETWTHKVGEPSHPLETRVELCWWYRLLRFEIYCWWYSWTIGYPELKFVFHSGIGHQVIAAHLSKHFVLFNSRISWDVTSLTKCFCCCSESHQMETY